MCGCFLWSFPSPGPSRLSWSPIFLPAPSCSPQEPSPSPVASEMLVYKPFFFFPAGILSQGWSYPLSRIPLGTFILSPGLYLHSRPIWSHPFWTTPRVTNQAHFLFLLWVCLSHPKSPLMVTLETWPPKLAPPPRGIFTLFPPPPS